jgi:hypothetical protein
MFRQSVFSLKNVQGANGGRSEGFKTDAKRFWRELKERVEKFLCFAKTKSAPFAEHILRTHIPVEPEAGTMPTNNSFRCYDYQRLFPFRPQPSGGNPEQPINSSKSGLWLPALQSQELLAKGQIFQQEVTSRIEAA